MAAIRKTVALAALMCCFAAPTFAQCSEREIETIALREYPNDERMQNYTYNHQMSACEYMSTADDQEVKGIAMREYPGDYRMQKYTYDHQLSAKSYMASSASDSEVKQIAVLEYPSDYRMQKYTYDHQLSAKQYMNAQGYSEAKNAAQAEYPHDYRMQKFEYDRRARSSSGSGGPRESRPEAAGRINSSGESRRAVPAESAEDKMHSNGAAIQKSFSAAVDDYILLYQAEKNELARSKLRTDRGEELSAVLSRSRSFENWEGIITRLSTTGDGRAYVYIQCGKYSIQTWNNSLSDTMSNTLIKQDSPVYQSLMECKMRDSVVFSGVFLSENRDFIKEGSVTENGAMTDPEFICRFSSIKKK